MDVYILDGLYRRTHLFDNYLSLVWADRFSAYGDFEVVLPSTPANRAAALSAKYASIEESDRMMSVDSVMDEVDSEGRPTIKMLGRSIEARMLDRVAQPPNTTLAHPYIWRFGRTPRDALYNMFWEVMWTRNTRNPNEIMDITPNETVLSGEIAPSTDIVTFEIKPKSLYEELKNLADSYDMGFGITPRSYKQIQTGSHPFEFRVMMGFDRTTAQSKNAPVLFSPELENVDKTQRVITKHGFKNAVMVFHEDVRMMVYGNGASSSTSGADLKIMPLEITDIDPSFTTTQRNAYLQYKAREELALRRPVDLLTGEVTQYSQYNFRTDYNLGDLVEMRNRDDRPIIMRVTEHIYTADPEGVKSYPTLALHTPVS